MKTFEEAFTQIIKVDLKGRTVQDALNEVDLRQSCFRSDIQDCPLTGIVARMVIHGCLNTLVINESLTFDDFLTGVFCNGLALGVSTGVVMEKADAEIEMETE